MSDNLDRRDDESFSEHIVRLYREMEPVVQIIFMAAVEAGFKEKSVPFEVASKRANDLIARYRAGYQPTIGDLEAIGAQPHAGS